MKNKLDALVQKFETKDFIKNDPVQFPHRFKDGGNLENIEIAGFIAALFAYGQRPLFIKKLDWLFDLMIRESGDPHSFLLDFEAHKHKLEGFKYRFIKDFDLVCFLAVLSKLYKEGGHLRELFYLENARYACEGNQKVVDYFYSNATTKCSMGFYHMLPNPQKGGAQKRFNMFLRWMIREGPVDLGVWDFKKKSELLIPLDVHVGNVSRKLGLLNRRANDFKSVIELTEVLKKFDPNDPVKYDFALFGAGVNGL